MTEFNARCAELRSRANARARRTVRSLRYQRFKRSLASLDESGDRPARLEDTSARAVLLGPVGEFASAVLERRYGQVRRKGRGLGGASSSERHRLRIAIKKFRYATDFFSGLYDTQRARHALRRLGRLQDILGAINDAAAIAELMAQAFGGAHGRRVVDARGIVLGWGSGRAAALKHELMGAWKEFRTVEKFW